MMMLQRVEGPACPTCGCEDSAVVGTTSRWGKPFDRRRCAHCGRTWSSESTPTDNGRAKPVIYHVLGCPDCGSTHVHVTRTFKPIRYHKCGECGHTFKSVERRS